MPGEAIEQSIAGNLMKCVGFAPSVVDDDALDMDKLRQAVRICSATAVATAPT